MSLGRKPFFVACIPAFDEEGAIAGVVLRASRHVDRVLVCDDGSTDMTAEIAESLWGLGRVLLVAEITANDVLAYISMKAHGLSEVYSFDRRLDRFRGITRLPKPASQRT